MICFASLYYRARDLALNNDHDFHVVAILKRGKSIVKIGTNSNKTNPRFARKYKTGVPEYQLHAEMNVVRFAKPGDTVIVIRFSAKGKLTMARPCRFCQNFLTEAGVTEVYYSDWEGNYQKMQLHHTEKSEIIVGGNYANQY